MIAERVEFNGEWHKDCRKCGSHYGAYSKEGLLAFFFGDRNKSDSMHTVCKACHKKYRRADAGTGRSRDIEKVNRQAARYPEKIKARNALKNAVAYGKIIRKTVCEKCESKHRVQAHHPDYSKPLDVMWLCHPCHMKEHGIVTNLKQEMS